MGSGPGIGGRLSRRLTALVLVAVPALACVLTSTIGSDPAIASLAEHALLSRAETEIERAEAIRVICTHPDNARSRPIPLERVAPRFPTSAAAQGQNGTVQLAFRLDEDGRPREVRVVEAWPASIFDSAAVAAVRRFRFCPPALQGLASSEAELIVNFDSVPLGASPPDRLRAQVATFGWWAEGDTDLLVPTQETEHIPCDAGRVFGALFIIEKLSGGYAIPITLRWEHPEILQPDSNTEARLWEHYLHVKGPQRAASYQFMNRVLDRPEELVSGYWRAIVVHEGEELASQTFVLDCGEAQPVEP